VRFVPVSENASLQETLGGPTLGAATGGQETDVKSNPVRGQRDSFATGRK
jgi:hypothetical protein